MDKPHYSFILASKRNGALFIGMAEDLESCVLDHKCNMVAGLTSMYAIHLLVYFERHGNVGAALLHEKALKELHRIWKLDLIERHNPEWRDLYDDIRQPGNDLCNPVAV